MTIPRHWIRKEEALAAELKKEGLRLTHGYALASRAPKMKSKKQIKNELAEFDKIIRDSKSELEAWQRIYAIKTVPYDTAVAFANKYNPDKNLTSQEAFTKYYNDIKSKQNKGGKSDIRVTEGTYPSGEKLWRVSSSQNNHVGVYPQKSYSKKEAINAYKDSIYYKVADTSVDVDDRLNILNKYENKFNITPRFQKRLDELREELIKEREIIRNKNRK